MQGIIKFTYLGIDSFVGKKDPTKTFYNVSLLQGSEIAKVFLETGQEELFKPLQKFDEIVCTASWRVGQDKYGVKLDYRIIDIRPLEIELPETSITASSENVTDIKNKKVDKTA